MSERPASRTESVVGVVGAVGLSAAIGALFDYFIPGRDVVWTKPSSTATVQIASTPHFDGVSVRGKIVW